MKPDWDSLGEKYEDSKKVLIGDVDCTGSGKATCERFKVEGYPTIKYFNPPDNEGEKYEGGRTLKELKKFAKTLGPQCTVNTVDKCSKKQLEELQPYIDMPEADLATLKADSQKQIDDMQAKHDELMKALQSQFEASDKELKALQEELGPKLKLMRAATKTAPAADEKKEEL